MNTAVAELDAQPERPVNLLMAGWARLDMTKKVMLVLGSVAMVGLLATTFYLANRTEYRVLFSNLSDKDGGAVVAQLAQMNVPYKYGEGGGAILVPAEKVHDLRLKMATAGLPKGATAGFELLDVNRLGMTQFQERLTFQRGLEGELTRSITALSSVADARVHLAIPNQNGFFREQQKPSASVLLTLRPGHTLDKAQIAGIVHLVASSIPEMSPKAVSILDQDGTLISQNPEAQNNTIDAQQQQYTRTLERLYTQRIIDLLEPVVGRENVRAQVTADVDFSQTEQTSEQHRPNQNGEPSTVRSQQLVETGAAVTPGVPGAPVGAISNQPPAPSAAPINAPPGAPANPTSPTTNTGMAGNTGSDVRRESVINYEVDKTVKVTRNSVGSVRRINAAVVLNHRPGKDKKGEPITVAIPPEQLAEIKALVQEAVGFNGERGDSVNVMNAPFTATGPSTPDGPWWKQPDNQELARTLAWPVGMLLMGLILFLGMIRPALKMMKAPEPEPVVATAADADAETTPLLDAMIDEETERPALSGPVENEPTPEMLRLQDAKRLALENPVAVANIIKGWVSGETT